MCNFFSVVGSIPPVVEIANLSYLSYLSYKRAAHYPREEMEIVLKFRFYFILKVVVIVRNFENWKIQAADQDQ